MMTNEEKIKFGEWLKKSRLSLGLTQRDLAERVELSFGTIQTIEIGKARAVGDKVLQKLEKFFCGDQVAMSTLKTVRSTGLEHLKPIIKQLAEIVARCDFKERVNSVSSGLSCSKNEAIYAIFEKSLHK